MLGLIGPAAHYAGTLLLQRLGVGDRLLSGYGEVCYHASPVPD